MSVPRGRRFSSRVPRAARTRHAASALRQNLPCRSGPSRRPIRTRAPEVPLRRSRGTGPSREATPLAIRSFASSRFDALNALRTFSSPPEPGAAARPYQARSRPTPRRLLVPGTPRDGHRHTAGVRSPPRHPGWPSRAGQLDRAPTAPVSPSSSGLSPRTPTVTTLAIPVITPSSARPLAYAGTGYPNHEVTRGGRSFLHREQPRD